MLPEIKINNNKGPMTGLDKVGYYSWLFKSYLGLPDKECDNKLTKYNVELMRICNEYNELKNSFLVKAHLVKEILHNGTNEGKYPYNIVKIMVSVKKQSSLMKALKFKLKKQGVNKEWFKVLKFNTDRITNRLIELDKKSLDTAVEMTEVGIFFRILRNQGIDPIEHIKNNVYMIEQEDYHNPEENKKQQESLKVYIDNMHKIIDEDTTLNNKDTIIQETQQNLDNYEQYRNEVKNKIKQHKQEYEDKANQDFLEVCQVKLDNYCIRFKKGIKDDNYDNLVIANKLLDRIIRLARNTKDVRIVAGKYIVVLIRTRGNNVFDIRFVSKLTKINLDVKPEKTWLKTTHSVEAIGILDEDEAKYIIENLNEARDKCIGKEIRLDDVYKFISQMF